MQATLVARGALDRWSLVRALDLEPSCGQDPETAFARLAHPTAAAQDLVLLVRSARDLAWLRAVRQTIHHGRGSVVVALVADGIHSAHAVRAGADAVVRWDEDADSDLSADVVVAIERARTDPVVIPVAASTSA